MHPIPTTDYSNLSPSEVCTMISQECFNVLPKKMEVLYQIFINNNIGLPSDDLLPFLFLRLGDKIEELMRFEQHSLFPFISCGSKVALSDVELNFTYVHRQHNRIIWQLRELEYFVNNVIDLRSKKTLQFITHLKALESIVLDWNYLVQEILAKQQKVAQK